MASEIASYKKALADMVSTLAKCTTLQESLVDEVDEDISKQLTNDMDTVLDSSALNLNKLYLYSISAELTSFGAEKEASEIEYRVNERKVRAEDASNREADILEQIVQIFEQPLEPIGDGNDLTRNQSQLVNKFNLNDYRRFAQNILSSRVPEADKLTDQALRFMIKEYINQHTDDDDLYADEAVFEPICPLTRKPLEDPVRADCGHFFSREAIQSVIGQGPNTPCPSSGCQNVITSSKLFADPFLKVKVNEWIRMRQSSELAATDSLARI